MKEIKAGIVDFEVYLPEQFIDAEDFAKICNLPAHVIIEKLGFKRKPVGGPEDHCITMAVKAAQRLLEKTGTNPNEIDLIIYPGEEAKEYICYTGSIKIQKDLGAGRCWAFDRS